MAKGQNIVQGGGGRKPPVVAPRPTAAPAPAKKRVGPVQFLREVRAEARKVTWTSWKETWITSIMVGIMVVATAIFFFGVDWILGLGISAVLKLANAE
jgi:preprotein translocase subunit SecE